MCGVSVIRQWETGGLSTDRNMKDVEITKENKEKEKLNDKTSK